MKNLSRTLSLPLVLGLSSCATRPLREIVSEVFPPEHQIVIVYDAADVQDNTPNARDFPFRNFPNEIFYSNQFSQLKNKLPLVDKEKTPQRYQALEDTLQLAQLLAEQQKRCFGSAIVFTGCSKQDFPGHTVQTIPLDYWFYGMQKNKFYSYGIPNHLAIVYTTAPNEDALHNIDEELRRQGTEKYGGQFRLNYYLFQRGSLSALERPAPPLSKR